MSTPKFRTADGYVATIGLVIYSPMHPERPLTISKAEAITGPWVDALDEKGAHWGRICVSSVYAVKKNMFQRHKETSLSAPIGYRPVLMPEYENISTIPFKYNKTIRAKAFNMELDFELED